MVRFWYKKCESKDCLASNQENVPKWSDMSTHMISQDNVSKWSDMSTHMISQDNVSKWSDMSTHMISSLYVGLYLPVYTRSL